jgi:hypothetical protein
MKLFEQMTLDDPVVVAAMINSFPQTYIQSAYAYAAMRNDGEKEVDHIDMSDMTTRGAFHDEIIDFHAFELSEYLSSLRAKLANAELVIN